MILKTNLATKTYDMGDDWRFDVTHDLKGSYIEAYLSHPSCGEKVFICGEANWLKGIDAFLDKLLADEKLINESLWGYIRNSMRNITGKPFLAYRATSRRIERVTSEEFQCIRNSYLCPEEPGERRLNMRRFDLDESTSTQTYDVSDGFKVDVVTDYYQEVYTAWIYHNTSGWKMEMKGVPSKYAPRLGEFLEDVAAVLEDNIDEYSSMYLD